MSYEEMMRLILMVENRLLTEVSPVDMISEKERADASVYYAGVCSMAVEMIHAIEKKCLRANMGEERRAL